ncbi:MAG: hypothetical protein N3D84_03885, partial [Candidatus Woesearchaeota archaeon]|nr:hypothetical protein [Candidatus Woesearchaeota archaeon]
THPSDDAHPTHRVANRIVTKAINLANPENRPKLVLNFETWRPFDKPDFIFPFDENVMRVKIKAMKQHKSQMRRADFLNIFVSLNLFRGIMGMGLLRSCVRKISKKHRKRIRRVYGEAFLIQRLQRSK